MVTFMGIIDSLFRISNNGKFLIQPVSLATALKQLLALIRQD